VRTVVRSTLVFLVAGLVGPLIRWVTPPTPTGQGLSSSIGDFIYSLVLLLWPAQPLAVIEVNTGRFVAAITSVGANLLLFGVAGALVGIFAKKPVGLVALYMVVCAMVFSLARWASGLPFTYLEVSALVASLLLYAVPFFIAFWLSRAPSR
jgi:hypothetical protein